MSTTPMTSRRRRRTLLDESQPTIGGDNGFAREYDKASGKWVLPKAQSGATMDIVGQPDLSQIVSQDLAKSIQAGQYGLPDDIIQKQTNLALTPLDEAMQKAFRQVKLDAEARGAFFGDANTAGQFDVAKETSRAMGDAQAKIAIDAAQKAAQEQQATRQQAIGLGESMAGRKEDARRFDVTQTGYLTPAGGNISGIGPDGLPIIGRTGAVKTLALQAQEEQKRQFDEAQKQRREELLGEVGGGYVPVAEIASRFGLNPSTTDFEDIHDLAENRLGMKYDAASHTFYAPGQKTLQAQAQAAQQELAELNAAVQRAAEQGRATGQYTDPKTGKTVQTLEAELQRARIRHEEAGITGYLRDVPEIGGTGATTQYSGPVTGEELGATTQWVAQNTGIPAATINGWMGQREWTADQMRQYISNPLGFLQQNGFSPAAGKSVTGTNPVIGEAPATAAPAPAGQGQKTLAMLELERRAAADAAAQQLEQAKMFGYVEEKDPKTGQTNKIYTIEHTNAALERALAQGRATGTFTDPATGATQDTLEKRLADIQAYGYERDAQGNILTDNNGNPIYSVAYLNAAADRARVNAQTTGMYTDPVTGKDLPTLERELETARLLGTMGVDADGKPIQTLAGRTTQIAEDTYAEEYGEDGLQERRLVVSEKESQARLDQLKYNMYVDTMTGLLNVLGPLAGDNAISQFLASLMPGFDPKNPTGNTNDPTRLTLPPRNANGSLPPGQTLPPGLDTAPDGFTPGERGAWDSAQYDPLRNYMQRSGLTSETLRFDGMEETAFGPRQKFTNTATGETFSYNTANGAIHNQNGTLVGKQFGNRMVYGEDLFGQMQGQVAIRILADMFLNGVDANTVGKIPGHMQSTLEQTMLTLGTGNPLMALGAQIGIDWAKDYLGTTTAAREFKAAAESGSFEGISTEKLLKWRNAEALNPSGQNVWTPEAEAAWQNSTQARALTAPLDYEITQRGFALMEDDGFDFEKQGQSFVDAMKATGDHKLKDDYTAWAMLAREYLKADGDTKKLRENLIKIHVLPEGSAAGLAVFEPNIGDPPGGTGQPPPGGTGQQPPPGGTKPPEIVEFSRPTYFQHEKPQFDAAFNKQRGQPGYVEDYDFNRDGIINFDDWQIFASVAKPLTIGEAGGTQRQDGMVELADGTLVPGNLFTTTQASKPAAQPTIGVPPSAVPNVGNIPGYVVERVLAYLGIDPSRAASLTESDIISMANRGGGLANFQ